MSAAPYISLDDTPFLSECDVCHEWRLTTGPHGANGLRLCARCLGILDAMYGHWELRGEEE